MYIYVLHNLTVWFSSFSKWIDLKTNFWGESNVIYFKFAKLCNMYRVYCVHYSSNEPEFEMKNHNFVDKVLQGNSFLNEYELLAIFKTTVNYWN